MDHEEDSIGAARPAPPRDPGRTQRMLLQVIAVASVAAAVAAGLAAWQVAQLRAQDKALYCTAYTMEFDAEEVQEYDDLDGRTKALVDALDCDVPGR